MAEAQVGILVGSESDRERMQAAMDELDARAHAYAAVSMIDFEGVQSRTDIAEVASRG